jgi:glycosyltransferase involved in cell wall biosynthesis
MSELAHNHGRKRICFVIDRLAARSGGGERVIVETANALAARGHIVEILTHENRRAAPFYPLDFGIALTNLRRPDRSRNRLWRRIDRLRERLHRTIRRFPFPIDRLLWLSKHEAFRQRLERHLNAHQPDVAVAFLPPAITALGLAQPDQPPRRVASLHNVPEKDLMDPGRWDPNPLDRRRRMQALAQMDAITVLLPEFRDWMPPDLRRKTVVVPNVVKPVSRARIRRFQREKIVMAVGRLAEVKRYDLLLDAWALLSKDFPDWVLRIFGTGPLEDEIRARIDRLGIVGTVRLMGHVAAIDHEYLVASILAHPAEFEGWGLAVTEALAAGVPVVAFADCPGVNQLIRDGETGLLVPASDDRPAALAAALARLMSDEHLRERLAAAAPGSMRDFAPEHVLDLWEALLESTPGAGDARGALQK